MEKEEHLVLLVPRENQAFKVYQGYQETKVNVDLKDPREAREIVGLTELLVMMDLLVFPGFLEKWERGDFLALEDFLDSQVLLVFQELRATKEQREMKVLQDPQDLQDKRGARDQSVHQARPDLLGLLVKLAPEVNPDCQVCQDPTESQETQGKLELQEPKDILVIQVTRGRLDFLVLEE